MIEFVDIGNETRKASYTLKNGKANVEGLGIKFKLSGDIYYNPLTEVWKIENDENIIEINMNNIFKATFENENYIIDVKDDLIYTYETLNHYVENLPF